jgi:cytoskeletal protein RodZ
MPRDRYEQDPYAPPPRHKDKSGALVRVVLIAAMLGLAVWGYTEFSDQSAPSLVAEEQAQQVADASRTTNPDGSYAVTPTPGAAPATTSAAPATAPEAAPAPQTGAPAAPADTPAPSTTIGTPGR